MNERKSKALILPKLAFTGITKNGRLYLPYLLATSLSVAIFFIFCAISTNELLETLPYSDYVVVLMIIGQVLLAIILAPFLSSTNRFLIKNRKRELGLYSILGLEKKHIGVIMLIETLITYAASLIFGIAVALAFSKLIFLLLLNLSGLAVQTEFTVSSYSLIATLIYFGLISAYNLIVNLYQVSLTNPSELFKSSKKGEKPIKHIMPRTIAGVGFIAIGYITALRSEVDSTIFSTFLIAVGCVVCGTNLLFTSGSLAMLKALMNNKKFFYKKENFITASGMFYRLKKSASSLANICIFCTMTIVTLICTTSLFCGTNDSIRHICPMDAEYFFVNDGRFDKDAFNTAVERISSETGAVITQRVEYEYTSIDTVKRGGTLCLDDGTASYKQMFTVNLLTLEDYNRTQNKNVVLSDDELLFFSSAHDWGEPEITIYDNTFAVKEEIQELNFRSKHEKNIFNEDYYVVLPDSAAVEELASQGSKTSMYEAAFNFSGSDEALAAFTQQLEDYARSLDSFEDTNNVISWTKDTHAMFGGLLFLGIFFGILFTICMVLIMYYKQVSEGLEDRDNFIIMQQVGMTDKDVHSTIRRQILTVFFLPIIAAVIHTIVAIRIVSQMMSVLSVFDSTMIYCCSAAVIAAFGVFYGISYLITARAYYKAVAR